MARSARSSWQYPSALAVLRVGGAPPGATPKHALLRRRETGGGRSAGGRGVLAGRRRIRAPFRTSRGRAGRRGPPRKARGGGVAGGALRRRRATPRGEANPPSPSGCGGRPPSPASLLLDVPRRVRLRRRSLYPAAWRSQRGSREVLKGALRRPGCEGPRDVSGPGGALTSGAVPPKAGGCAGAQQPSPGTRRQAGGRRKCREPGRASGRWKRRRPALPGSDGHDVPDLRGSAAERERLSPGTHRSGWAKEVPVQRQLHRPPSLGWLRRESPPTPGRPPLGARLWAGARGGTTVVK